MHRSSYCSSYPAQSVNFHQRVVIQTQLSYIKVTLKTDINESGHSPLNNVRILLAEDNMLNAEIAMTLLARN